MAQQISTNTFGVAKWIVSSDASQGTHTTIAGALTSASSGDTIYIRDGSYTENLTLKAGVTLTSFSSNLLSPNVIIIGNATAPATGTVTIAGIGLQTNSAALLTLSGTSTSTVNLIDCNINCLNNTGITFSSSDSTAKINIERCYGNIGTTGIALFSQSATGALNINYTTINNSGNSTTASTQSGGQLTIDSSYIYSPITTSGTTPILKILNSRIDASATNTTCITHGSTNASASTILMSFIASGSASAISVSASASLIASTCTVSSTNTNAITGAGTVTYSAISFTGSSSLINTTTQTSNYIQLGKSKASGQPAFLATANAQTDVTGDGTTYTLIYANEIFDQGSDFDGTSTFTAPVTGRYHFDSVTEVGGLVVANTAGGVIFAASNRSISTSGLSWGVVQNAGNTVRCAASALIDMDVADTCKVTVAVTGGAKVADIGATNTIFSGSLTC